MVANKTWFKVDRKHHIIRGLNTVQTGTVMNKMNGNRLHILRGFFWSVKQCRIIDGFLLCEPLDWTIGLTFDLILGAVCKLIYNS